MDNRPNGKGFILTMRNLNKFKIAGNKNMLLSFILTMRNLNSRDRLTFDSEEDVLY